jgi:hypothetical protein
MGKKSVVLYTDYKFILNFLSYEEKGQLLDSLLAYVETSVTPAFDNPKISNAFGYIKNRIDANTAKYEKRSQAGKKGMEARWGKTDKNKEKESSKKEKIPKKDSANITNDNNGITNDNKKVSNDNVNDNVNVNENVNTEIIPKQTRVLQEHQKIFNLFAEIYYKKTGSKYKSGKKDFVLLADLVKNFNTEEIIEKIRFLVIGCEKQAYWFTNSFSDFTIGKLYDKWNELLPKLTSEQQKQKEIEERDRKIQEKLKSRQEAGL